MMDSWDYPSEASKNGYPDWITRNWIKPDELNGLSDVCGLWEKRKSEGFIMNLKS